MNNTRGLLLYTKSKLMALEEAKLDVNYNRKLDEELKLEWNCKELKLHAPGSDTIKVKFFHL